MAYYTQAALPMPRLSSLYMPGNGTVPAQTTTITLMVPSPVRKQALDRGQRLAQIRDAAAGGGARAQASSQAGMTDFCILPSGVSKAGGTATPEKKVNHDGE